MIKFKIISRNWTSVRSLPSSFLESIKKSRRSVLSNRPTLLYFRCLIMLKAKSSTIFTFSFISFRSPVKNSEMGHAGLRNRFSRRAWIKSNAFENATGFEGSSFKQLKSAWKAIFPKQSRVKAKNSLQMSIGTFWSAAFSKFWTKRFDCCENTFVKRSLKLRTVKMWEAIFLCVFHGFPSTTNIPPIYEKLLKKYY